jgi:hypothetical protein
MQYLYGEKVCIANLRMFSRKSLNRSGQSQIRKVSHLRKVRKSNRVFNSANLRIYDLRKLFVLPTFSICTVHYTNTSAPAGVDNYEGFTPMSLYLEMALVQPVFCTVHSTAPSLHVGAKSPLPFHQLLFLYTLATNTVKGFSAYSSGLCSISLLSTNLRQVVLYRKHPRKIEFF